MSLSEFESFALRRRAETQVARGDLPSKILLSDPLRLLHELEVHRIELEMQNEELLKSNHRLEELRDEYQSLYDLAPVGYLTVSQEGLILRINDRAAEMMNCDLHSAISRPLRERFAAEDVARVDALLREAIESSERASSGTLLLLRPRSIPMYVRAQARSLPKDQAGHRPNVLLALMDVSALKFATDDVLSAINSSIGGERAHR
jgi:PAS domain-containing protein